MKKVLEDNIEDRRNVQYFISKDSSLQNEISLLKIYLTPFELYILKFFMINPSPKTTREIQIATTHLLWNVTFKQEGVEIKETPRGRSVNLLKQLGEEGYFSGVIQPRTTKKTPSYFYKISYSEEIKEKQKMLKENGVKIPSFDFIKSIMQELEKMGFLATRERKRNIVFYMINPKFYMAFKNKSKEIIEL